MLNGILLIAYTIDPIGGSEPKIAWNNLQIAASFSKHVHIITTEQSYKSTSERIKKDFDERVTFEVIKIPNLFQKIPTVIGEYLRYYLWIHRCSRFLLENDRFEKIDLAHHISLGNLMFGTPLINSSIPYIFGPAGGATKSLQVKGVRGKNLFKLYERTRLILLSFFANTKLTQNSLKKASLILATNRDTYNTAIYYGATSVELLLADTIDTHLISKRRKYPNDELVIWAGRFVPRKAPVDAIEAFKNIQEDFPNARMLMYGSGPMFIKCQKLINRNNLQHKIILKGRVPWQELLESMHSAKCFLFTSLRDSFGSQVLEAAASGTPTVSTSDITAAEWIKEPALIFGSEDSVKNRIEQLSEGLQRVLSMNKAEWRSSSNAAINFARNHSTENRKVELGKIYRSIVNSKKSNR